MLSLRLLSLATLLAVQIVTATSAAPSYYIEPLDIAGGGLAINNRGQVTGTLHGTDPASGHTEGFWYSEGDVHIIDGGEAPSRLRSLEINNHGTATGEWYDASEGQHKVFTYDERGLVEQWRGFGMGDTYVRGINDAGVIVGFSTSSETGKHHAFKLEEGVATDYGTGGITGINNNGVMIGTLIGHGWVIIDGNAISTIPLLPEARNDQSSDPSGINDHGVVVGSMDVWTQVTDTHFGYRPQAYIYDGETIQLLDRLPGDVSSGAGAINNSGWVIGSSGTPSKPFLYDGEEVHDLNDLLAPSESDWSMFTARDINDEGQIIGTAIRDGEHHMVILTLVPEPSSILLMGAGALLLLRRRRHA